MADRFTDSFTMGTLNEMLVPHGSRIMSKLNRLQDTSRQESRSVSSLWGAATAWGEEAE